MIPSLLITMVVVFVGVAWIAALSRRAAQQASWAKVAEQRRLRFVQASWPTPARIEGSIDDLSVTIQTFSTGGGKNRRTFTRAVVRGATIPASLKLSAEGIGTSIAKAFGGQDIATGDARFDSRIRVQGGEALCRAALSGEARDAAVAAASAARFEVSDGAVSVAYRGIITDGVALDGLLSLTLTLARALAAAPPEPLMGLVMRIQEDPDENVRRVALETLITHYSQEPRVQQLLSELVEGSELHLAILSAMALPSGGARELSRAVESANLDAALRARALRAWSRRDPEAASRWLGSAQWLQAPSELAAAACGLAESLLGQAAEPMLLKILSREEESLQLAAVQALGSVGTVNAVEKLLPFSNRIIRGELGNVAKASIQQIQSRAVGADAGWVSLASNVSEAGGLSQPMGGGLSPHCGVPHSKRAPESQ